MPYYNLKQRRTGHMCCVELLRPRRSKIIVINFTLITLSSKVVFAFNQRFWRRSIGIKKNLLPPGRNLPMHANYKLQSVSWSSLVRMRYSLVPMKSSLVQMRSSLVRMRSSLVRMRSSLVQMRSSLVQMRSGLVRMRSSLVRMRSGLVRMRSSLVQMRSIQVRMRSGLGRMRSSLVRMRSSLVVRAPWVRSQHPSAQLNLRGGRWSSVEYTVVRKKIPKNIV